MKYRDVLKILEREGFELSRQAKGSHRIYKRKRKLRDTDVVLIAYHKLSDEVAPGTLANIIRTSHIPKRRFRK